MRTSQEAQYLNVYDNTFVFIGILKFHTCFEKRTFCPFFKNWLPNILWQVFYIPMNIFIQEIFMMFFFFGYHYFSFIFLIKNIGKIYMIYDCLLLHCEGGVVFCQFVKLYICHTSPREGGVKVEFANVTKYAGFFLNLPLW